MPSAELDRIIRKHALKNALDYGKASPGSVVGKVIGEFSEAKKDMKATMARIGEICTIVNSLGRTEIETELKDHKFAEKKEEKKTLSLPNAEDGKVVTRFPPEPSGYLHIGHAKAIFLDYEAAAAYNGKFVLHFDDTNPENESQEFVDAIMESLAWLGVPYSEEYYSSDQMQKVYSSAEKGIGDGKLYVCTCQQETVRANREQRKGCACRELGATEQLSRWGKMLDAGYKQGDAAVRLRGNLSAMNTTLRDPTLLRIVEAPHYRHGMEYRVWPTYDFITPIMVAHMGISHIMRSKEYELRDDLYRLVCDAIGVRMAEVVSFSRLAIKNAPISKRLIKPLVQDGKVLGWDDPRLPTLAGLRRRGITPAAIRNFVMGFGLSKVESEPGWEKLLSENRKLLETKAPHYFFVPEPVRIRVNGGGDKELVLRMHPKEELGTRRINVSDSLFISKDDYGKISLGETFRLKDLYNARLMEKGADRGIAEHAGDAIVEKKIQWVPEGDCVEIEVLKPGDLLNSDESFNDKSLERITGYAERSVLGLAEGDIVQFERFGFCRLDKKGAVPVFIFSC